ncbi:sn-glycerol-3-phosphate ABC transporter ATP-binding protein UgpC [Lachnospiraceae bacterium KGMB03038]|nr:sn-glycerol-3-phosphate ABC transporter ATP-binding protein UgpC [Lachnospiraceae bacterium KGMB03038]
MNGIQLKHVYKEYENGFKAVKDFQLEIEEKEFVIFVGPSGCGKSTTLRMIAGLEDVSQGEIVMDGKIINQVQPCDRNMAMVFQNYALYPHMSVWENMAYSLKIQRVPKAERRKKAEEVAKILDLSQVLDRKPGELSGGQKQRVAIGRAIIRRPRVFLMDEPLSNLDAKLRTQMRGEILKLYRQLDATFIYVTHDQTEAMTLGTKIVVLKDGEIQQVAPPRELYDEPANVFVAGFIGMPQMNFFHGKCVVDEGRQVCLKIEDRLFPLSAETAKRMDEKNHIGEEVIVGVRPEDMVLDPDGIASSVRVCEKLGAATYLYLAYGKKDVAVRVPADSTIGRGDNANFSFRMDKVHIFDAYTQQRV